MIQDLLGDSFGGSATPHNHVDPKAVVEAFEKTLGNLDKELEALKESSDERLQKDLHRLQGVATLAAEIAFALSSAADALDNGREYSGKTFSRQRLEEDLAWARGFIETLAETPLTANYQVYCCCLIGACIRIAHAEYAAFNKVVVD